MADRVYRFGEFSIAPEERRLFHGTQTVPLAPKAFDALMLLVKKRGNLVGRDEITRTLWPGIHVSEANLTNIIVLLRRALCKEAIETVSKFGYRLTLQVSGGPEMTHAAYESFVRGKELLADRSIEGVQGGRDLFLLCVATDPQFGEAWAWLGRSCHLLYKLRTGTPFICNRRKRPSAEHSSSTPIWQALTSSTRGCR